MMLVPRAGCFAVLSALKHGRSSALLGQTQKKIIWQCISRATKYSDCVVLGTKFEIYINEKDYRYTCFCDIFIYTIFSEPRMAVS